MNPREAKRRVPSSRAGPWKAQEMDSSPRGQSPEEATKGDDMCHTFSPQHPEATSLLCILGSALSHFLQGCCKHQQP